MVDYKHYQQIRPGLYKRRNQKTPYLLIAILLFSIGGWFFLKKAPAIDAYAVTGITFMFGIGFLVRMFNNVTIDMTSQMITQKSGLFSATKKIALGDIEQLHINNRIYVLLMISSAFAVVHKAGKSQYILLGQSFMNPKRMEGLLLETETIIGRR